MNCKNTKCKTKTCKSKKNTRNTKTITTECNLVSVKNKTDIRKNEAIIKAQLTKLYGNTPKGDWRVWTYCSGSACLKSKTMCMNPNHYFLYNAKSRKETTELRQLFKEGHIKTLPSAHKRVIDMKNNKTLNTTYRMNCEGCGESVSSMWMSRHIKKCDAYKNMDKSQQDNQKLKSEHINRHSRAIETIDEAIKENQFEVMRKLFCILSESSLRYHFKDNQVLIDMFNNSYQDLISKFFSGIDDYTNEKKILEKTVFNLMADKSNLEQQVENITDRFKDLEKKYNESLKEKNELKKRINVISKVLTG
jgi:hypothetical protein